MSRLIERLKMLSKRKKIILLISLLVIGSLFLFVIPGQAFISLNPYPDAVAGDPNKGDEKGTHIDSNDLTADSIGYFYMRNNIVKIKEYIGGIPSWGETPHFGPYSPTTEIGETMHLTGEGDSRIGYSIVDNSYSTIEKWVKTFNGDIDYVNTNLRNVELICNDSKYPCDGTREYMTYLGDIAKLSGAYIKFEKEFIRGGENYGLVYAWVTEYPSVDSINLSRQSDSTVYVDIDFSEYAFTYDDAAIDVKITDPRGSVVYNRSGLTGSKRSGSRDESTTHKTSLNFESTGEGNYRVEVTVIDGVERQTSKTETISVGSGGGTDPQDPNGPIADFRWSPTSPNAGDNVRFRDESMHPDNLQIVQWEWKYSGDVFSTEQNPNYEFETEGQKNVVLTVTDENGKKDDVEYTITVGEANLDPIACISGQDEAYVGDSYYYDSCSYDPDGQIALYGWDNGSEDIGDLEIIEDELVKVTFKEIGTFELWHGVDDFRGGHDETIKEIEVLEPIPTARIKTIGQLKVNKKIDIDISESETPGDSVMEWELSKIEITPVEGQNVESIKYSGSLDGVITKPVMFKEKGYYKITATVKNNYGYSDTTETVIFISPDKPPEADFNTETTIYREENSDYAFIKATDNSRSPDGDTIAKRIWTITFDSDNDGNFEDETPTVMDDGNTIEVDYRVNHVGEYKLELEVIEGGSEDVIPEFYDPSEALKDDTTDKELELKIVDVNNYAPDFDYEVSKYVTVNINFPIGDEDISESELRSAINSTLLPKLHENNINLNYAIKKYPYGNRAESLGIGANRLLAVSNRNYLLFQELPTNSWGTPDTSYYNVRTGNVAKITADSLKYSSVFMSRYSNYFLYREHVGNSNHGGYSKFWEGRLYDDGSSSGRLKYTIRNDDYDHGAYISDSGNYLYYQGDDDRPVTFYWKGDRDYPLWTLDLDDYHYGLLTDDDTRFYTLTDDDDDRVVEFEITDRYNSGYRKRNLYVYDVRYLLESTPNDWVYYTTNNGSGKDVYRFHQDSHEVQFLFTAQTEGVVDKYAFEVSEDDSTFYVAERQYDRQLEINNYYIVQYDINGNREVLYSGNFYDEIFLLGDKVYFKDHNTDTISTIKETTTLDLDNDLLDFDWDTTNPKYYVPIFKDTFSELNDTTYQTTFANVLLNNDIKYYPFGSSVSQSQHDAILNYSNSIEGMFINNSNLTNSLTTLANEIIAEYSQSTSKEITVTLDDNVNYEESYADFEGDPKYSERHVYRHDATFYENSMGTWDIHEQQLSQPVTQFDKVGRYTLNSEARDNPVESDNSFDEYRKWSPPSELILNVHRKPIPEFDVYSRSGRITVYDYSYDLDKYSDGEKGIKQKWWHYREVGTTRWYATGSSPPSWLQTGKTYEIQLTVQDFQGEYAVHTETVENVSTVPNQPPVAYFTYSPTQGIEPNDTVNLYDESYDPEGDDLIHYWQYYSLSRNEWTNFSNYNSIDNTAHFQSEGDWRVRKRVQEATGEQKYSEWFEQIIPVRTSNTPPTPGFTHQSPYYIGQQITLRSTAIDADNDPLTYRYTVEKRDGSIVTYQTGDDEVDGSGNLSFISDQIGNWMITQYVTDGKSPEVSFTDTIEILDLDIEGAVNHPIAWEMRRQKYNLRNSGNIHEPWDINTFLAGEAFKLSADTTDTDSTLIATHVLVTMMETGDQTLLAPVNLERTEWEGEIAEDDHDKLPEGPYTFLFEVLYSNDIIRNDEVIVNVDKDSIHQFFELIRVE
ncbi:PKD domain-containing protein [Bacillus sp. SCS-151]|uniref:PKD domain-containing protein n=1 Tax=Nanhaiella sioensis TaxID=3115293 RepID=UPI003978FFA6